MIIVKLNGGLGNQLFQYALGRKLSLKNNQTLKLNLSEYNKNDFRHYSLNHYNIIENIATSKEIANFKKEGWRKIIEKFKPYYKKSIIKYKGYGFDPNILNLKGEFHLDGYWQSEKYFKDIEDIIREEITLKKPLGEKYSDLIKNINNSSSISIHIRRGDYLSEKISKIYETCSLNYYTLVIDKIKNFIKEPAFFVFSDDIVWVKDNLTIPYPTTIVNGDQAAEHEELFLMSLCKHNIIANSSFSWWGAWLNQNPKKIIIGPKKWFKFSENDLGIMPESWIKL